MKTFTKCFIVTLALVVLSACSGLQPKPGNLPVKGTASLEELVERSGANVVRAFTCLTGGTTGCLDKISRTVITNGDIAMVVTGNIIYFYQYNSSATDAESSPTYIRPDDYATEGVWYLVDVRAKGVNTGTSTTPSIDFYDSDATAGDINAKVYVNCTDTGNGTEDCDIYIQSQTAGDLTTKILIDADGNINLQAMGLVTTGAVDFGGATSIEIPNGTDPDVDTAGEISWDTDDYTLRVYDGTNQVAIARKQQEIHVTVVKPQDLADAVRDAFLVWSNESGFNFIITGWKAWAGADDTSLNIETTAADGSSNATVDAVEIATGSGPYTASDTTITAGTIANGSLIWLDFDDTDDPSYVKLTIYGYYNGDVD